ncbi:glucose-6-phosphate isomerase [Facklamia sp. DSM 111018]|uniref:Glucose-6-phosphate isomerase n=1 Tax=Facklamia lactis TaxID=2749967 RepID=A0ABS0LRE3_9LACT|nr:glucose-6-phosphate isomerase [Facklamia lactis]MBG9981030.1 glucose-6-phosphate isomerase [Facklamia lactis]MBG9986607.1 glucose-6-phosphate isomerase [Facklamia lactis]
MKEITFNYQNAQTFIGEHEAEQLKLYGQLALEQLLKGAGAGAEFTDWVNWPQEYNKEEYERIKQAANKIVSDSEVLIVVGIGGSYLGSRAAIEFLNHTFYNIMAPNLNRPQVLFAGNNISSTYLNDLIEVIGERDFSINMISKSGTTTEPAIAFRVLKEKLISKYGEEEANKRIYATTDRAKGALKQEADEKDYECFVIPDGIGGRFTVLTAVGLLPIAVTGANIDALMFGAQKAMERYTQTDFEQNLALQYAVLRNCLYRKGKDTEILVNYEPALQYFGEWWKQLFGESEGKDHKGIFPASANFSTDLHSIGQIIQDGKRNIFETVIQVGQVRHEMEVPKAEENLDGLKYLEGATIAEVNRKAYQGTLLAHTDGQVPNFVVTIPAMDEESLGQLIYFFEMAVAISGYLNGVNPFDQPGVEAYKKNMFALLGKPGHEELAAELETRL